MSADVLYVFDCLLDSLTDESLLNVDDQNNGDVFCIITRGPKSKFQLTIGVFSIAYVMPGD